MPRKTAQAQPRIPDLGALGEELVAQWLQSRGLTVLQRRWHCRWGELDLVVGQPQMNQIPHAFTWIAFVEVKTRGRKNWDANGALAVNARKQAKLWRTAQDFLMKHPGLAELPCRFDVALVSCNPVTSSSVTLPHAPSTALLVETQGEQVSLTANGYRLTVQTYIQAAFFL